MTDLERARKEHELVGTMADAFRELTDEYWHDAKWGPWPDVRQLNIELGHCEVKQSGYAFAAAGHDIPETGVTLVGATDCPLCKHGTLRIESGCAECIDCHNAVTKQQLIALGVIRAESRWT